MICDIMGCVLSVFSVFSYCWAEMRLYKIMVKQERCVSAMFIYKNKLLTFRTRVLHQSNVHKKVSANEKNK